jgi:hypothetical protein
MESVYKNNRRTLAMIAIAGVFVLPMALDGFTQLLFTSYESNAILRLATGTPFGIFLGAFIAASFSARPALFTLDPTRVILPSGSRFQLPVNEEE